MRATRRHALLLVCGSLVAALLPAALLVDPRAVGLFIVVPPLLGYGLLEIHRRYGRILGRSGRVGVGLVGLAFVAWLFGTLLLVTRPGDSLGVAAGAALLGGGLVAAAPGSALLASDLRSHRVVSRPLAIALGGALFVPLVPAGYALLPLSGRVPVAASLGVVFLSAELYWLAWAAFGVRLYRVAGATAPERLRLTTRR